MASTEVTSQTINRARLRKYLFNVPRRRRDQSAGFC